MTKTETKFKITDKRASEVPIYQLRQGDVIANPADADADGFVHEDHLWRITTMTHVFHGNDSFKAFGFDPASSNGSRSYTLEGGYLRSHADLSVFRLVEQVEVADAPVFCPVSLLEVADAIEADPTLYDQHRFARKTDCGTAFCVCGWALYLSGRATFEFLPGWRLYDRWSRSEDGSAIISSKMSREGAVALGFITEEGETVRDIDYDVLFDVRWTPPPGMTVPAALRLIHHGQLVPSLSYLTGS